jgi:hypothetical protein
MAFCLLSGVPFLAGTGHAAGMLQPGASALSIAVQGSRMTIGLEGPAGNFVSFGHRPATAGQTAELARTLDVLRAGDTLFLMPPEAACTMESAAVSPPAYDGGSTAGQARLTASWQFRCSNTAALMWIDVRVLAGFPGTEKIVTSIVTPVGQKSVVLTPGTPRVLLPRPAVRP